VTDYGAVGDDSTDNSTPIANALAACSAGQTLFFPAGTYLCNSTVTAKDGVHMSGASPTTSWIKGRIIPASNQKWQTLKLGKQGQCFGLISSGTSHDVEAIDCRFTGGDGDTGGTGIVAIIQFYGTGVIAYNYLFQGCTIEKGAALTGIANGVYLDARGWATNYLRDIVFDTCTWEGGERNAFELTVSSTGTEANPITTPHTGIDILHCVFEPCDNMAISYCGRPSGADDQGEYEMGYGTIHDNWIKDANVNYTSGSGNHALELNGVVHVNVTDNTIEGSYVENMMDMSTGGHQPGAPLRAPLTSSYHVITGNVFDGTDSPDSTMTLKGKDYTFSGNTVKVRGTNATIQHSHDAAFSGNDWRAVNSDGSLHATMKAAWISGSNDTTFTGDTFRSKANPVVYCSTDYHSGTLVDFIPPSTYDNVSEPMYANDIQFTNCIWYRDAGEDGVTKDANSSFTNTNPTYYDN